MGLGRGRDPAEEMWKPQVVAEGSLPHPRSQPQPHSFQHSALPDQYCSPRHPQIFNHSYTPCKPSHVPCSCKERCVHVVTVCYQASSLPRTPWAWLQPLQPTLALQGRFLLCALPAGEAPSSVRRLGNQVLPPDVFQPLLQQCW